ncbi:metalloprotease [Streptomyces sp. NBC_00829]|uniref:metalloprotease n=1 Tax=Streptomyces sp. NBC_00829 TaxID=2903679 RepID=UPI00386B603A|nr:metalloprotease [Streptomyces sp. NBC_00829]
MKKHASKRRIHSRLFWSVTAAAAVSAGSVPYVFSSSASALTRVCMSGTLVYHHKDAENGLKPATSPARSLDVELWGKTTARGADSKLATGRTTAKGSFRVCHNTAGADIPQLWVRFLAQSTPPSARTPVWKVIRDSDKPRNVTFFDTARKRNVKRNQNFGIVSPPSAKAGAWKVADTVNPLYSKRHSPTPCWTRHETAGSCTPLTYVWPAPATAGSFYDPDRNVVVLTAADAESRHLTLHETGHFFHYELYEKNDPPADNCDPHFIDKRSSPSCAWTEAFANGVAAYALGDRRFVFPDGFSVDLSADRAFATGDEVEGRVGASLLDLWEPGGPDGGNWNKTIDLMARKRPVNFREYFLRDRPSAGLSISGKARAIIRKHTINY